MEGKRTPIPAEASTRGNISSEGGHCAKNVVPSCDKRVEKESGRNKHDEEEVPSHAQSVAGDVRDSAPNLKVLCPSAQERIKVESESDDKMEEVGGGRMKERPERSTYGNDCKFTCDTCGLRFAAKSNLRKHVESHIAEEMRQSKVYSAKESVGKLSSVATSKSSTGLKTKKGFKQWECDVCKKKFKWSNYFRVHRRIHTGEKPYECPQCKKTFAYSSCLTRHLRMHAKECDKGYQGLVTEEWKATKEHRSDENGDESKYDSSRLASVSKSPPMRHVESHVDKENSLKSEDCPSAKGSRDPLGVTNKGIFGKVKVYYKSKASSKQFECHICEKKLQNIHSLRAHYRTHTGRKPFLCEVCGKAFGLKGNLVVHLLIHTEERGFCCTQCPKRFKSKSSLKKHSVVHSERKPHRCKMCDRRFRGAKSLESHLVTHTGYKAFQCEFCDRQFFHSNSLRDHRRISHSRGEMVRFRCEVCSKGFPNRSRLRLHLRTHTGEKPFQCRVCHKCFSYSTAYKNHQMIHSGEKPFSCPVCDKTFSFKSGLSSHSVVHSGVKAFRCEICNVGFYHNSGLKMHMKNSPMHLRNC